MENLQANLTTFSVGKDQTTKAVETFVIYSRLIITTTTFFDRDMI